ncbi:BspA family leucine-rich repeat surface protein [Enterococcus faecalis]|uniref:BspA family leucine-rich repeat surface protein n=1 Tax=Enterococcus faecalis TaxID=1351 RepID=UPI0034CEDF06
MSKKKLTKKRKKQLLALFATTSVTVNMVVTPMTAFADRSEGSINATVIELPNNDIPISNPTVENNLDIPKEQTDEFEDETINALLEKEDLTDEVNVDNNVDDVKSDELSQENSEEINKIAESENIIEENETKSNTLVTGTYAEGGIWVFNKQSGVLMLSGGKLDKSTQYSAWRKELNIQDILEIQVIDVISDINLSGLFKDYVNLKKVNFDNFQTARVLYMDSMFSGCSSLTALDLSTFDTSNVTSMADMFSGCSSLTALDLSTFDTSNVTSMAGMFSGCSSLTALDLSTFDTSNIASMAEMFRGCISLTALDLSTFDTSKVTSMAGMFRDCSSLTALDLSTFDTSKVTSMNSMFSSCSSLTALDLSTFDTNKVTNMAMMFFGCSSLTALDLSTFDTSKVISSGSMFHNLGSLLKLTLGSKFKLKMGMGLRNLTVYESWHGASSNNRLDTTNDLIVYHNGLNETNTYTLFNHEYQDGGIWEIEDGILTLTGGTLSESIGNNTWLKYLDKGEIREIHVKSATGSADLTRMFSGYENVEKIIFHEFDTSKSTKMYGMFQGNKNLVEVDISTLNTSNVTNMAYMFHNNNKLSQVNLDNLDTSKVTDMTMMFANCEELETLDLSYFSYSSTTGNMFLNTNKLKKLILGGAFKLSYSSLGTIDNTEFWYEERSQKILNTARDLVKYHNEQNETSVYVINSSAYKDEGIWRFNDGILTLTGGTLSADIGNNSWLKYLDKADVQEIQVVDAVGAENLSNLFAEYSNVQKINFDDFDTSKVLRMNSMFSGCRGLIELDLSSFDTSRVITMSEMFNGCRALRKVNLNGFDTNKVTNMASMFNDCRALTELDISSFNTSNVSNMSYMFDGCRILTELDLSSFDTSGVTNMYSMFQDANRLTELKFGEHFEIDSNAGLKELESSESWKGELENNHLDSTDKLLEYHNSLSKTNSYLIVNPVEEFLTLSFDTVGGSQIDSIETKFGDVWLEPSSPVKEGYNFVGWYVDAEYTEAFDFSTSAVESLTIYAKWEEEKANIVFEVDDYYIGSYNIIGRFNAPIVTAQLRINGAISNLGGTFNHNEGTFYYYTGAGRIQMGQEVMLEGIDSAGNIVETVKIEPKVAEGSLDEVRYVLGENTLSGEYSGDARKARLVINGTIVSVGGEFENGKFSYYVKPNQIKETDKVQIQGYDVDENPVGDLKEIDLERPTGKITEASYQVGDSTIVGTYEGSVKKARLIVDGKPLSWGGTFDNGTFTYYVPSSLIKETSIVELEAYSAGDVLLSDEKFPVVKIIK